MRTLKIRDLALLSCLIFGLPACGEDTGEPSSESDSNESEDSQGGRPSRPDNEPDRDSGQGDNADAGRGDERDVFAAADVDDRVDVGVAADAQEVRPDASSDASTTSDTVVEADTVVVPDGQDCTSSDERRYACCVLEQVNLFREENGLPAYQWDTGVSETAFYYANYMARNRVFAHSADGMNFGERLDEYNVAWASAGENLQRNDLSLWNSACNETVNGRGGWANSRNGHREAMLGQDASGTDKQWTHAAAGVARDGNDWYVAMYFVRF